MGEETSIGKFNEKMLGYLKKVKDALESNEDFSEIKCFQLIFTDKGQKAKMKEASPEDMDIPNDYIAYYWMEFFYKEKPKPYRFTLFFKDFDHGTGNIHVIPGMFQFWEKRECKEGDSERFTVYKDKTSEIKVKKRGGFPKPYTGHPGGCTYSEEGWEPCVMNAYGREFYNIIPSEECVINCMLEKITTDFEQVISEPDALKTVCKKATESSAFLYDDSLIKDMYSFVIDIYGSEEKITKGTGTYSMLKWVYRDESGASKNRQEKDEWRKMTPLYSIVHIKDMGFFCIYGRHRKKLVTYDLNEGKRGINIAEGDYKNVGGTYYWKINKNIAEMECEYLLLSRQ